ncbi:MAG: hypothetical protein K2X54_17960 [Methylobacterium organophilum]|nr:hypothetical protein [Methylobacterium organophilum]
MRNENVVEFPTGRLSIRPPHGRPTVAALTNRLAFRSRLRRDDAERRPLPVELRELAGVSDETVDLLTALVERRILTPASAARLAMRHASEIDRPSFAPAAADGARPHSHHLVLAGDLFSRSAFRVEERASGAWVACATFAALDLLFEVCPIDGMPFYILPSLDGRSAPSMVVRTPCDWQIDLARRAEAAERAAERYVLVIGGLPDSGQSRATIIAGVRDGLRRNRRRTQFRQSSPPSVPVAPDERNRPAYHHLVLIEIAFPGLIHVLGDKR